MDEANRARLNAEWLATNAFREVMHLATEGDSRKSTYDQALAFGATMVPSLLGQDSLIKRAHESEIAREYRQLAEATSAKEGKEVSALSLLQEQIDKYDSAIKTGRNQQKTDQIKKRLSAMQRARDELDPNTHSEHALIFRDAYNVHRELPEIKVGHGHKDFKLSNTSFLRIRVFHPDKAEQISGADVFYERHDRVAATASVVAVQYKIWEDKTLHLSDGRMQEQLGKMKVLLCDQKHCSPGHQDHSFRFPYCSAFLRPTDKLQTADQRLASTGEHLPICQIKNVKSEGPRGAEVLTHENICRMSLNHEVFEGLFTHGKIGSRTLSYPELQVIYSRLELANKDKLLVHAQDFMQETDEEFLFKNL